VDEVEFYIWVGKLVRKHRKSRNMSQDDLSVLQRTQFDGHKIDALLTISFTNAFGDEVTEVMRRIWLLFHMDEGTRAVLSHYLCVKPEYAQSDVLHCFRKTIIPHERATFTIPGFTYPKDKLCFHSEITEAQWALWDEVLFDNDNSHLTELVKDRLTAVVNCSVNPGPVAFPEVRGILERFFGVLTQRSIRRGAAAGS
jgi:putative transposase